MNAEPDQTWVKLILIDGLLVGGTKFAILMLVGGYFIEWYFDGLSLSGYLSGGITWYRLLFYFVIFGLFVGIDEWYRNDLRRSRRS